jgi:hypothetical protein
MKVTSFQDVPHSPKRMAFQTHAVRLYLRAFAPSRLVEVRRIVFHSASKKRINRKIARGYCNVLPAERKNHQ